jgi:hypothetical protein
MNHPKPSIPNPRLIAAIYFALLAVIATFLLDITLMSLGVIELLPIFQSIILAAIIAAIFGGLFGKLIILSPKPYKMKAFIWGFLMVIAALPFYCLGLLYFFSLHHPELYDGSTIGHYLALYGFLLLYSFILAGLWLAIVAGFASIYLRGSLIKELQVPPPKKKHKARLKKHVVKHP